jgi:hypothetical protein
MRHNRFRIFPMDRIELRNSALKRRQFLGHASPVAANNLFVCHPMAGADLSQEMALSRRPNGQHGVFANQVGPTAAMQNNPMPTKSKLSRTRQELGVRFDNGRSFAVQTEAS